ncbi:Zinc finger, FYVE-type [Corchorus olitorius]|uniref:Zinc finger, FYVE-type n=1 Tax=Corchorus olitorius TaxID=93759 RepID=A0A1R3JCN4_9ROSI|nr:Zinc finger, FYVE-type [Corchorus olitorius]
MEGQIRIKYPQIQLEDYQQESFSHQDRVKVKDHTEKNNLVKEDEKKLEESEGETAKVSGGMQIVSGIRNEKKGNFFYYDTPLSEETGVWIPVSVPPMSESEHEEWNRSLCLNGGYFPDDDLGWNHFARESKDLTLWDVFNEMLIAARGKVSAVASGDVQRCGISWLSSHLLEQAWKEMAQTLTEANFGNIREILEAEPPKWLPDSAASACMLCNLRFHPFMRPRHHCRYCGGIFCNECSKGRSLLPRKFRTSNPQRVCDVCCVRLESVQSHLMDHVSRAAQLPTQDLTDLSTLRSWLNFPWGQSMEYEIYKAANTIRNYNKVGSLKPEKSIPDAILKQAKGLAILTIAKVGVMVTYNVGTGLVVARREDGTWSPPSAISSFGVGWGAQAGGEFTDFIIVLRTESAVRTFSGNIHLSVGAGLSAAVGIVGRAAEADLRGGSGGLAACYTYSCSKGAFVGCSLEGSVVTTRNQENCRFYGNPSITASDILLGSLPRPPAAATLYQALSNLFEKLESTTICLSQQVTNNRADEEALLALKAHITHDPQNIVTKNWSSSVSICDWFGVSCGSRHKRVTTLILQRTSLNGTLPPQLGNLSFLTTLDLRYNNFHGNLPPELANLRRLKSMILMVNHFSGNIPEQIGSLPQLQNLFLSANGLSGSIPTTIFNSSTLQKIVLATNNLEGIVPENLCDHLPQLLMIEISFNNLSGKISPNLQNCRLLQVLGLSNNRLTGSIPRELGNLTMLKGLYLGFNQLEGEIPRELSRLVGIERFAVENSGLTGQIPPEMFNLSSLIDFVVMNNSLSGSLPTDLCRRLPNLEKLFFFNNKLDGTIPRDIGNCTFLKQLRLGRNNFTVTIH